MIIFYVCFTVSSPLRNFYAEVLAADWLAARDFAQVKWPSEVSMIYTPGVWKNYQGHTIAQRANLRRLEYE